MLSKLIVELCVSKFCSEVEDLGIWNNTSVAVMVTNFKLTKPGHERLTKLSEQQRIEPNNYHNLLGSKAI